VIKYSMFKEYLKDKGQTSVEYILLISVIAIIATSLFKNIDAYLVSNPDSVINEYLGALSTTFGNSGNGQFQYKRFVLRR